VTLTIHTIETTAPVQALDPAQEPLDPPPDAAEEPAILDDILIDELSIDGMCGVY
jgi:mycofactocin precursor